MPDYNILQLFEICFWIIKMNIYPSYLRMFNMWGYLVRNQWVLIINLHEFVMLIIEMF